MKKTMIFASLILLFTCQFYAVEKKPTQTIGMARTGTLKEQLAACRAELATCRQELEQAQAINTQHAQEIQGAINLLQQEVDEDNPGPLED